MPRKPRTIAEGDVVHARTRFVNEEFRIEGPRDRERVREFLGRARLRSDALILAYAIMSSHIHLLLLMGKRPLADFYLPFHTMLGIYLNRAYGRLGPVVAGRPWADVVRGESIYGSLRYVHENQWEAGAAKSLATSHWTSHPHFIDPGRCPSWLDVHRAAHLAGFDASDEGVVDLAASMERQLGEPIIYHPAERERSAVRRKTKAPVELGTPVHSGKLIELPIVARTEAPIRRLIECDLATVLLACAEAVDVPVAAVRARDRRRKPCEARALALHVWCAVLEQPAVEMATYLGVSESAASRLRGPASKARGRALTKLDAALSSLGLLQPGEITLCGD